MRTKFNPGDKVHMVNKLLINNYPGSGIVKSHTDDNRVKVEFAEGTVTCGCKDIRLSERRKPEIIRRASLAQVADLQKQINGLTVDKELAEKTGMHYLNSYKKTKRELVELKEQALQNIIARMTACTHHENGFVFLAKSEAQILLDHLNNRYMHVVINDEKEVDCS